MSGPRFGTVKSYHENQVIFKEGQPGNVGYLVKTGEVTIYKIIDDKKKILSTLGPGEVFGEMGIVTQSPRTAFAEATQFCDLVIIDKDTLFSMLKQSPKLVQSITLLLMKRLSATLDMLQTGGQTESGENLFIISQLFGLINKYDQGIDYGFFCKTAKAVSNIDQEEMDGILQLLSDQLAIEITNSSKENHPSGWCINVLNPGFLPHQS